MDAEEMQRTFATIDEITQDFADKLNAGLEDSFRLQAQALSDIAQALRSIARSIRGEQDSSGLREIGR